MVPGSEIGVVHFRARNPLRGKDGDEGRKCGRKRPKLQQHQLKQTVVESPQILLHLGHIRRQMHDRRTELRRLFAQAHDELKRIARLLHGKERTAHELEWLVAEVAAAGEDHRRACGTHHFDDFVVALRPARLDDPRDAGLQRSLWPVGEREECI